MAAEPKQRFSRRLKLGLLKARTILVVSERMTTKKKAIKYGGVFIDTFPKTNFKGPAGREFAVSVAHSEYESPYSVALAMHSVKTPWRSNKIAEVKLAFTRKGEVVMLPQGEKYEKIWLGKFRRIHKKPWANFLIEKIEEHAKKCGFKKAKIPLPEGLTYFQAPYITYYERPVRKKRKADIRASMRKLYYGIAENMGYKEKGAWLVKEL